MMHVCNVFGEIMLIKPFWKQHLQNFVLYMYMRNEMLKLLFMKGNCFEKIYLKFKIKHLHFTFIHDFRSTIIVMN